MNPPMKPILSMIALFELYRLSQCNLIHVAIPFYRARQYPQHPLVTASHVPDSERLLTSSHSQSTSETRVGIMALMR